jgi:peroxiredoxin
MKRFLFAILSVMLFAGVLTAGDMKPLKTGAEVPGFVLASYDGKKVDLADLTKDSKYTVIMFIATRCPVSNAYNERMASLATKYSSKGVSFVGINSNREEKVDEIADHSKDNKFSFPVLKDEANLIADAYAAAVTPEIFVVGKDKKLLYHGRIDDNKNAEKVTTTDLSGALDMLLAGKQLTGEQYKAFGCSIKRVDKATPKSAPES